MSIEKAKQQIRNNVKFKALAQPITGGQSCGVRYSRQRLYSEELDLTIETGFYRSTLKNRELLHTLFELTLDELIK